MRSLQKHVTTPGNSSSTHRKRARLFFRLMSTAVIAASVAALLIASAPLQRSDAASATVRVKSYYLALGTSLAFGQQPNGDNDHGYPQQWFTLLQHRGSKSLTNYGCPGMTSTGMFTQINCAVAHNSYNGKSQLGAALAFIAAHRHQVSPVSLDMGANDLFPDIHVAPGPSPTGFVCTFDPARIQQDEDTLDANLRYTILPQLVTALQNQGGQLTGDLVMMNYYYPLQNTCPETVELFQGLNARIAADVAFVAHERHVRIRLADVFTAFGGPAVPNPNICVYTWFCPQQGTFDIHATTRGYRVIAQTFNSFIRGG